MFQRSERIQTFINAQGGAQDEEPNGFLDFIHEIEPYDELKDLADDNYDDFDKGFALGKKAGDQPVFECDMENGDLCLYFIGMEEEILTHLKVQVAAWWKKHPQEPPEAKVLARLREAKTKTTRQLKSLQVNLASLEQQEAQILNTLPKKHSRKKK